MDKIKQFIKDNKLKPSDCTYHTKRKGRNRAREPAGYIRVIVPKTDDTARCEYTCPECSKEGYEEKKWKRPFSVKCKHCGYRITVPKLKGQAKRERKKEKSSELSEKELEKEIKEEEKFIKSKS